MNTRSTNRSDPSARTRESIFRSGSNIAESNGESLETPSTAPQTLGRSELVPTDSSTLSPAQQRFLKSRQLAQTERKLIRSCEHVILLNDKIRGLTKRYKSAREEGFKSFRYNLRIRLAAVEGVRNMYYEYARDRAEEVAELRKELYDQNVEIVTASDDESDLEVDMEAEVNTDDEENSDAESLSNEEDNAQ